VIANAVERLPIERSCECSRALAHAILTRPDAIPDQVKRDLGPIVAKYLNS
jgi:5'-methylthioadenosine phosphorylase